MKSGVPWQVQVRPEARETAREAARRSGMSVSEWLDSLIIDSASREGIEPAPGAPAHLSTDDYPDWDRDPLPPRRPYADDDRRHRPVARDDRPEPAAYHDTSRLPGPRSSCAARSPICSRRPPPRRWAGAVRGRRSSSSPTWVMRRCCCPRNRSIPSRPSSRPQGTRHR